MRLSVAPASVVLEDAFDEPRQLERSRADGVDRLLVVHPYRAKQRDRAELPRRQPVARTDERDVAKRRVVELAADANERSVGTDRPSDQLEECRAALEQSEGAPACIELVLA